MKSLVVAAALAAFAVPALAQETSPVADEVAPFRMAGAILNVADLDGMTAWYRDMLGMHVVRVLERGGAPYENILGVDEERGSNAVVGLMRSSARQDGATTFGRLLFHVENANALAEQLEARGVSLRRVGDGIYFITDPEGNTIELYTLDPGATP